MNRFFSSIFIISSIIFFTACERSVNLDIPYKGDKIVINAIINKDSLIYARITSSTRLNGNYGNIYPIPNGAAISLFENDQFKEVMKQKTIRDKVYFVSTARSITGKKYTLKATADGMTAAEGSDIIPQKPSFYGTEYRQLVNSVGDRYSAKLKLKIKDPAGVKNYYRLVVYSADSNRSGGTPRIVINRENTIFFTVENNPGSNQAFGILSAEEDRKVYFNDDTFDGLEITITIGLSAYSGGYKYIAPELTSLSRDAYRYLQSRETQINNDGNPFAEAVIVYNNITGGYGIVGGMADSITVVRAQ